LGADGGRPRSRTGGSTIDPLAGSRGFYYGAREPRHFKQSSIGAIYTDAEYPAAGGFNRMEASTAYQARSSWAPLLQSVVSSTLNPGSTYRAALPHSSILLTRACIPAATTYKDISPGFKSLPGFVNRVDIRDVFNEFDYRFRPQHGPLVSWGPSMHTDWVWAHDGTRLDLLTDPSLGFRFKGQSFLTVYPYTDFHEQLRPVDFPALPTNRDYHEHNSSIVWGTSYLRWLTFQGFYTWGDGVNFIPPNASTPAECPGPTISLAQFCTPFLARSDSASTGISLRPLSALRIDNVYLFSRLRDRDTGAGIFNNHIIRTKWNWQFNRELSVRMILQYTATLANSSFTSVPTTKQFNGDFLITYLVTRVPGYVGYNSDFQNIDPQLAFDPNAGLRRT
jgi:hypothetical protein